MVEVKLDTNGDRVAVIPNVDKRLLETFVAIYLKRGWFLENREECYRSTNTHITIKLRLPSHLVAN